MRVDGWETRYAEALRQALAQPFVWGVNDCATMAFDVRRAMTGIDDAARWRGRYSTEAGAIRTCRKLGWSDFVAMGRDLLGEPLPTVLMAQRGDLVLGGQPLGWAVVTGWTVVGLAPAGAVTLPLDACKFAWRVG